MNLDLTVMCPKCCYHRNFTIFAPGDFGDIDPWISLRTTCPRCGEKMFMVDEDILESLIALRKNGIPTLYHCSKTHVNATMTPYAELLDDSTGLYNGPYITIAADRKLWHDITKFCWSNKANGDKYCSPRVNTILVICNDTGITIRALLTEKTASAAKEACKILNQWVHDWLETVDPTTIKDHEVRAKSAYIPAYRIESEYLAEDI